MKGQSANASRKAENTIQFNLVSMQKGCQYRMVLPSFFPRVEPPLYQNQPLCNLMYGIHTYPCNSLTIEVLNKLH